MKVAEIFTDAEIIQIPVGSKLMTAAVPDYGRFQSSNTTSYIQYEKYAKEKPPLNLDIPLFSISWSYTDEQKSKLFGRISLTGLLTLSQTPIQCSSTAFSYIRTQLDDDREQLLKQHSATCEVLGVAESPPEMIGGPSSVDQVAPKSFPKFTGFKTLLTTSANETGYHVYFIPLDEIASLRLSFSPSDFDMDCFESLEACRALIESLCDDFVARLSFSDGDFASATAPQYPNPTTEDLPDNSW